VIELALVTDDLALAAHVPTLSLRDPTIPSSRKCSARGTNDTEDEVDHLFYIPLIFYVSSFFLIFCYKNGKAINYYYCLSKNG
jgi:hypothetical protein